ncbi:MAG: hypothetical protein ACOYB7_03825 [Mycobacterium sp.]
MHSMKAGLALMAVALVGFVATLVIHPLLLRPHSFEDLTAAWSKAGPTALGTSAAVAVPPGATLVAFLVGTQLLGSAGTTTGTCSATSAGRTIELGSPVQIERSLTGILKPGQETVAVAGWTNNGSADARVEISCQSSDSGVDHFVAVPTRTGVVDHNPWFQPWAWVALAVAGGAVMGAGLVRPTSR